MADLARMTLSDMVSAGAVLRRLGQDAASMEDVAAQIVDYLWDGMHDAQDGARNLVLVRFYKTERFAELPEDLRRFATGLAGEVPAPSTRCLTLLATRGEEPAWNRRQASAGHCAVPLTSEAMVDRLPMIAQLMAQLGVPVSSLVGEPDPDLILELDEKTYNVFYVAQAAGSPHIPAQASFVEPYGVASVLGFGGMLSGDLFAVVLFSRAAIPPDAAELFKTLALSVKVSLLPLLGAPVFADQIHAPTLAWVTSPNLDDPAPVRARRSALEQLLEVLEATTQHQALLLEEARVGDNRRLGQLQGLAQASLVVNSSLSLEATLATVTERARGIVGCHQAVTSLTVAQDWAQAVNAVSLSEKYAEFSGYDAPPDGSGIYAVVCETNRPLRLTQEALEAHPRWRGFGSEASDHPPMRGWLAAPLVARGGANLGLLQVSDKADGGDFSAEDEAILVQLAQMASVAIENRQAEEALRQSEASLRISEQRHRSLVEATSSIVWTTDPQGAFVETQGAWEAYTGQAWQDHRGFGWGQALHPGDRPAVLAAWEEARAAGRLYESHGRLWHAASGAYRHFVARASPIAPEGGEVTEWIGTVTDIEDQVITRRQTEARAECLRSITAGLAAAPDEAALGEVLASQLLPFFGADTFALAVVDPEDHRLRAVSTTGLSSEAAESLVHLAMEALSSPVQDRGLLRMFGSSLEDCRRSWPELADWHHTAGMRSWAGVAMAVEDQTLGLLHLGYRHARELLEPEEVLLETVAAVVGQTWLRADRLRVERETARQLSHVQEISDIALAGLGLEELLGTLLPRLAKVLGVDVVRILTEERGGLSAAGAVGVDLDQGPVLPISGLAGKVAVQRAPVVVEELQAHHEVDALRQAGVRAWAGVPLLVGERLVGVLEAGSRTTRRFRAGDLTLLVLAAERIALAVERSRSFEVQRALAVTLQAALLPPSLPQIPGLDVATRYRAGGEGIEVGGDFYDLFSDGRGGWYLVVGDVCGRGIEAANLTSLLRHTARAVALDGRSPADILTRLNDVIAGTASDERFATASCSRLQANALGEMVVRMASGGHCPPLLRRADGSVETISLAGTMLGVLTDLELSERELQLFPGDCLLLYTDGLTEAHGPDGLFGEERVRTTLELLGMGTAEEVAEALDAEVLAYSGGIIHDDMAIVVLAARTLD